MTLLGTLAGTVALGLSASPALAAGPSFAPAHYHSPAPYTCTGGEIPSGTYRSITVTGACSVPSGAVVKVTGNVYVAGGAQLDAQSAPSTITVGHNVIGAAGSFVGLGCQPPSMTGNSAHECATDPEGHSTVTVKGNVTAVNAAAVMLNGATVKQNVVLIGGGSAIPWSVKNTTIGGNLVVSGQKTDWLGALFNTIRGNAVFANIVVTDIHPGAPGVYIVRNTVTKNLVCYGLTPGVSGGFVPGSVNVVGGHALGQCADLV